MEKGFDDKNSNRRGADKKDYQVDYAKTEILGEERC